MVRVEALDAVELTLRPYIGSVETETRSKIKFGPVPTGATAIPFDLDSGSVRVGLMPKAAGL